MKLSTGRQLSVVVILAMSMAACGKGGPQQGPPPTEVEVVRVSAEPVPLVRDVVGRLAPTRAADVRARVTGVLLKRLYQEGSDVKEGQVLFQIDPKPLQAALNGALASLAQAEANATNARIFAQRNRDLIATGAVSKSDVDTAEANERSTAAMVQQARASVETARINLGYASVRAPISGRSGQQRVTEGALVGEGEATLLTTIEQVDPIYVNFDQPAADIQLLRRAQAAGELTLLEGDKAQVQVVQPDGTIYGHAGTLDFSDVSVNPTTGALAYRGVIPNPERQLLPGLFVNVRVTVGQLNHGFLVPQAAVQRDNNGAFVQVVNAEGKVEQKRITTAGTRDNNWIISSGLTDGDQVIVAGIQKAPPGAVVKAVPQGQGGGASAAAAPAADGQT